jgi:negative regulator of flagellin synthesis FlgM
MKIGQTPDNSIPVQQGNTASAQKATQNVSTAAASTAAAQGARSAGVAVIVSTFARGVEKTGRNEGASFDAQKVATIKAAIQDGSYSVNPEAIADKLLTNAQEMLNRTTN